MSSRRVREAHEAPALGDAIVRMMRALVKRAADGDQEAIEQLQRIAALAPAGVRLGVQLAHEDAGYSWSELGAVLRTSRQAAQQLGDGRLPILLGDGHVLQPGHTKRGCPSCERLGSDTPARASA